LKKTGVPYFRKNIHNTAKRKEEELKPLLEEEGFGIEDS
jgi:hypothetical protein